MKLNLATVILGILFSTAAFSDQCNINDSGCFHQPRVNGYKILANNEDETKLRDSGFDQGHWNETARTVRANKLCTNRGFKKAAFGETKKTSEQAYDEVTGRIEYVSHAKHTVFDSIQCM